MLYELYNDTNTNICTIYNPDNNKITNLSTYKVNKSNDILSNSELQIGLHQDGSNYRIFLGPCRLKVYKGKFDTIFEGSKLYNHEIILRNTLYINGGILLQIRCNCWGIYGVEVPLYMEHTIFLPTIKGYLEPGILAAVSDTPFIVLSKAESKEFYKNIKQNICYSSFNKYSYCKKNDILNLYGYKITPKELCKLNKPINILDNMRNCKIC